MSSFPSVQLMTEATIAQYIHEISARHRRQPQEPRPRRVGMAVLGASERRPRHQTPERRRAGRRWPVCPEGLTAPASV